MLSDNKSQKWLNRVLNTPADIKDFILHHYNQLVDDLNNNLSKLSFSANFDGELVKDQIIGVGATVRISHRLGVIPLYRVILRQSGGGAITDGVFAKNYVELINTGATEATISVIILKE